MLSFLISLMEQAEEKCEDGATRKEWVMVMVQTSAEYINYPVDTSALSTKEEDAKRSERSKLRDLLLESYR